MSTETGPDLTNAVAAITALMDDTCTLTLNDDNMRAPRGSLNAETLQIVDVTEPTPYYTGPCKISPDSQMNTLDEAQRAVGTRRDSVYAFAIPVSAPVPVRGSTIVITSSRRSTGLVGRKFRITEVLTGTFQVQWKCRAELYEGPAL